MVHYTTVEPTEHYLEHHADVPWGEVFNAIIESKRPRKKNNKFQYENKFLYILCEKRGNILFVINAKRK